MTRPYRPGLRWLDAPASIHLAAVVACLAAILPSISEAGVISVVSLSLNNIDALLIAPPAAITNDALTINPANNRFCAFVFEEAKNVVLPKALLVDVADTITEIPTNLSVGNVSPGGVIPAGTRVSSVYVHFDTPLNAFAAAEFAVHLNENILGVIMGDKLLDDSDPILGLGGTAYPTNVLRRGMLFDPLEALGAEGVNIGVPADGIGPSRDLAFRMEVEAVLDGARIITATIPEPGAAALLLVGCGALVAVERYWHS